MYSVSTVLSVVLAALSVATAIARIWLWKKSRELAKSQAREVDRQKEAIDHIKELRKKNSELAKSQAREVDRQQKAIDHLGEVSNDLGKAVISLIATTKIQRRAIRNLRRGMGWMVGVWLVIAIYVVVLVLGGM